MAQLISRHTHGALRFDSVLRFKGGQAPAVILIDVEAAVWAHGTTTPVLYCGMTRASLRLDLFVAADSPIAGPLRRAEPVDALIDSA
ncbi:ATP-binding domain-containing protein [Salinisphaera japonica]|uniref:UvrD-like helicase C-terminal domain-containing protein n=1 Tax=Salinisphaera japonica YTM-1 TaxID=1209778 RepID=A0A423PPR8_9GAMM|nr:ATP-binding domain-containing protein [Salinisphaera japonica]ROO27583.1 hypothetical protein SAJA_09100 [Salinisphaera japonica YTM-1]